MVGIISAIEQQENNYPIARALAESARPILDARAMAYDPGAMGAYHAMDDAPDIIRQEAKERINNVYRNLGIIASGIMQAEKEKKQE